MLLNLLTFSAFVGIAVASYGNNNAAASPPNAFFFPRHHHREHRWRSSSSSESGEKWDCARLGIFNVSDPTLAPVMSAPKIAYYTHQGDEKAIIVCDGPQLGSLLGQSKDANAPAVTNPLTKDIGFLSLSTRAGHVLNCNKRQGRYEAFNLVTRKTIPIDAVACLSLPEDSQAGLLTLLGSFLAIF